MSFRVKRYGIGSIDRVKKPARYDDFGVDPGAGIAYPAVPSSVECDTASSGPADEQNAAPEGLFRRTPGLISLVKLNITIFYGIITSLEPCPAAA